LGINVMANVHWGIVAIKTNIVVHVYSIQGNAELSYQTSHEALRIADESGDIFSKAHANFAYGISFCLKGYLEEAEKHLLKAIDFCQKSNLLGYAAGASTYLGYIYLLQRKDYKTVQEYCERSISLWQLCSMGSSFIMLNKTYIALAKVMNKEKDINLNKILKFEDIKSKWFEGLMSNHIAKILLNIDGQHISEAEDWIKRSIEINQKYGIMGYLAQDYALYAEWFKRKGDPSKAKENLIKAIEIFKECGADGWVERYEKELASLS